MTRPLFFIGLDDTDAPDGMCTTWLGAMLIRILRQSDMTVLSSRLVRLNPTIPYKTRGNAAISIHVRGDPEYAFHLACSLVLKYAAFSCPNTHPGVVVAIRKPPADFYWKAVSRHCTIEEVKKILAVYALDYRGYKLGRGLIGATAAICSDISDNSDYTWELLAYRSKERLFLPREIDADSLLLSEELTSPHTWDTWDYDLKGPVCIPHTSDPVLYGIRGDSPFSVSHAASVISSEPPDLVQVWMTNQGTDAHLVFWDGDEPEEGISYLVRGIVHGVPATGKGGHVSFPLMAEGILFPCMAFEPTKKFRDAVRSLRPGDEILACGSYLKQTLNLEKMYVFSAKPYRIIAPPICPDCAKRMTSAGSGKGYKCRRCGKRESVPEIVLESRTITPGWYEVPPGTRRHLSRPLSRGFVLPDPSYLPTYRSKMYPENP